MTIRFTAIAASTGPDPIAAISERARMVEDAGFDVISHAQMLNSEVFPGLMAIAAATKKASILTRVAGAFTRSPTLLASGAAWVEAAAPGRFLFGLGAGTVEENLHYLAIDQRKPGSAMIDVLKIIRGCWGEEVEGVTRNADGSIAYAGLVHSVETASIDYRPARKIPLLIAAAGPRMLRTAGALCDGVILELTTPQYIRWAWDRVREGAAMAGRSLDGFEMCVQASWVMPPDESAAGTFRLAKALHFAVTHCVFPEFQPLWKAAGLTEEAAHVAEAERAGDRAEAERRVQTVLWPRHAITAHDTASFWRFIDGHAAEGITMFALPAEVERLAGVTIADIRARLANALSPA